MLIIGCDFHPGVQQVAIFDNQTGEIEQKRLGHREEAEQFYRSLPAGTRVGMEACGHYPWFERLLAECGHELWLGDPAQIRASVVRKQKTDRRDAEQLLDLRTRALVKKVKPFSCQTKWRDSSRPRIRLPRIGLTMGSVVRDRMTPPYEPREENLVISASVAPRKADSSSLRSSERQGSWMSVRLRTPSTGYGQCGRASAATFQRSGEPFQRDRTHR